MWSIGKLKLKSPVVVAPMAGITDYPFREMIRVYSSALLLTEFVSGTAVSYRNARTIKMMTVYPGENPIGIQIFGHAVEQLIDASRFSEKLGADVIDLNLGCPVRKVVRTGAGAALLRYPEKIFQICSGIIKNISIPLTVKIRLGYKKTDKNYLEVADAVGESGVSAITVHGRFADESYSTPADREPIYEIKSRLSIPVIGNGDIFTPEDALEMKNETGCDAVMLGRGICGNPWIIRDVENILLGAPCRKNTPLNYKDKTDIILHHLEKMNDFYGEKMGIAKFKKHLPYYLKGWNDASILRYSLNQAHNSYQIHKILKGYLMNDLVQSGATGASSSA